MTQLVLGGSGFIGSRLTRALADTGRNVLSVGRRFLAETDSPGVERRELDLYACSQAELASLIGKSEVVYHLAWSTIPATAEHDPGADLAENVSFMLKVLVCARETGCRLVFCSSGGTVYGASTYDKIAEDHPLKPVTAYGAGKVAAEVYAGLFHRAYDVDVRIARLANPYGSGQRPERLQGALTRFATRAKDGVPIEIWGDGQVIRDYLHIDDAVDGLLRIGGAPKGRLGDEPVFNIGSGHGTSLNNLVKKIEEVLQRDVPVIYKPGRPIDVARNVLAVDRAADRLGWRPRLSLLEGVRGLLIGLDHDGLSNLVAGDQRPAHLSS